MARKSPKRSRSPKSCPPGMIKRKGYVRSSPKGKKRFVKPACIKKQGSKAPRQRVSRASPKAKRRSSLKCGPGMIVRDGYRRKSYMRSDGVKVESARVGPVCVKDIGRKGKGSPRIQKKYKLRKGALTNLGYQVEDPEKVRHAVLERAIESGTDANSLKWKLNAQYVYRKNARKGSERAKLAKRFKSDVEYLKRKYPAKSRQSPKAKRR